jgi:hypothetical protein
VELVDISFKDTVIGEENLNQFRYEIGGARKEPIEDDATDRKEHQNK